MHFIITTHGLILFVTAIMSLVVGFSAFRHKRHLTGKLLTIFMAAIFVYTFCSSIQAGISDLKLNILWAKISYVGYVWLTPLCFLFVMAYADQWQQVNITGFVAIGIIPLVTLVLVWTNEFHKLIWSNFLPGNRALNIIIFEHGPWFYVFLLFQVCMYTITLYVLLRNLSYQKKPYQQQSIIILVATLLPAVAGLMYSINISPIPGLDWMPVLTFLTGVLFYWGIFHYRLLDLVPIARDTLIEQMLDGLIVLDDSQRIIDINENARAMIPGAEKVKIGDLLNEVLTELHFNLAGRKCHPDPQIITFMAEDSQRRHIDVRLTPLKGVRTGTRGSLLILTDVTRRKEMEDSLSLAYRKLEEQLKDNQRLQSLLREESIRDPLTRLYNRRYLEDALQREASRALRDKTPITLIMVDIDHFKLINDNYGHSVGDKILKRFAQMMLARFRREDIVCRYGGEEFLIMMPATEKLIGFIRIEEFRSELEETIMDMPDGNIQITFSAGVAAFPEDSTNVEEVLKASDNALYQAKTTGRNRVVTIQDQNG